MFRISRCTRTTTHDIIRDIMDLLTIFIKHGRSTGGTRIRPENDTVFKYDTGYGRACLARNWRLVASEDVR